MSRRSIWFGVSVGALAVCLAAGYLQLVTTFRGYDDEGYLYVTIREFLERGGLYEDVYSQYGPLYAQFWSAVVGGIGFELNHDSARVLVLASWAATSVLIGVSVWRLTQLPLFGIGAQLLTFVALRGQINEPLHPGGLTSLLLAVLVALVAFGLPRHPTLVASSAGVILAALTLVKVNVGAFAVTSVLLAGALTLPGIADRRFIRLATLAIPLVPIVVMAEKLGHVWVQRLAIVVIAGVVALITIAWARAANLEQSSSDSAWPFVGAIVAGFVAAAAGVLGVAMITGTSVRLLLDGVILEPLGQPDAFTEPFRLPPAILIYTFLGLMLAVAARLLGPADPAWTAAMSLVAGTLILVSIADPTFGGAYEPGVPSLAIGIPLAWVAAIDFEKCHSVSLNRFGVVLLPALAVLQALHVYPVAGSQVGWAAFLLVPVAAVCMANAWARLRSMTVGKIATGAAALLVAFAVGERLVKSIDAGRAAVQSGTRLDLVGANSIRLPPETASVLENVTRELTANCSTFVTLPGMNSFYVWVDDRPPTGLNVTSWMYLFDEAKQLKIVQELSSRNRVCVVTNRRLLALWAQGRPIPNKPLYRFATSGLDTIAIHGDYTIARKR